LGRTRNKERESVPEVRTEENSVRGMGRETRENDRLGVGWRDTLSIIALSLLEGGKSVRHLINELL
jgi:hypothetical protein